jgi:hypothetical protein
MTTLIALSLIAPLGVGLAVILLWSAQSANMRLIDICHKRWTACIEMAESCADTDNERRKAWLELAKQWSRLPEETVLRKAALVRAISRSPHGPSGDEDTH